MQLYSSILILFTVALFVQNALVDFNQSSVGRRSSHIYTSAKGRTLWSTDVCSVNYILMYMMLKNTILLL